MPIGRQSYPALNQTTVGYRVLNPQPMDVYLGPWESIGTGNTAGTTSGGVSLANSIISGGVRYQGLQVIIIANSNPGQAGGQTLAYKYWYRGGTADSNLVEFASGAAVGTPFDSSISYNWTAPQYFSAGFSAAGGVTFTNSVIFAAGLSASGGSTFESIRVIGAASANQVIANTVFSDSLTVVNGISASGGITFNSLVRFPQGLSAAGATLGVLAVNSGATVSGRLDVGGILDVVGGVTLESTLDVVGAARFVGGLSAARVYASQGSTFIGPVTFAGITATRVDTGTLATTGLATLNSLSVTNNATIGGTLDVYGNLYVQGTLTTVNETQLLIQDKYLVLGSTLNTSSLADGAGVYVGATVGTNAIAGICYSHASTEWSSSHSFDIPSASFYRVGGTNVLASTYLGSAVTGSSLASVGIITSGQWRGTPIGLTWGGLGTDLDTSNFDGVLLAVRRSAGGSPRSVYGIGASIFAEYTVVGGGGIVGDSLSDSLTPFWLSGESSKAWTTSVRGHRKSRKTSVKRYDQVWATNGLDDGTFSGSVFNPSVGAGQQGERGVTFTIPLSSLKTDNDNLGREDYVFWDDYNSSSTSGVSAMSYNLQTGIIYFKQVEAIVDGGTW